MIIAIGDLHGDWGKLNALIASKRPEVILQCGDFGWWPAFETKRPVLYGMQKKWTHKGLKTGISSVYFCDGNHEQHPALIQDGLKHEMYGNVFHASRGSVLALPDGRNVLFFGGAASVDKDMRTAGHDWFPEENISQAEFERCFNLDCKIDIIISHTCPNCFGVDGTLGKINDGNRFALSRYSSNSSLSSGFSATGTKRWQEFTSQHGQRGGALTILVTAEDGGCRYENLQRKRA